MEINTQIPHGDLDVVDINRAYEQHGFNDTLQLITEHLTFSTVSEEEPGLYNIKVDDRGDDWYVMNGVQSFISLFRENHFVGVVKDNSYYYVKNVNDKNKARITIQGGK